MKDVFTKKYWEYMNEEEKLEICKRCPRFLGEVEIAECEDPDWSPYDEKIKCCDAYKKERISKYTGTLLDIVMDETTFSFSLK